MKIQVTTGNLQKKLPFLNHTISSRSQLPVLLNILLEAKNGKLTLASTDLEIGVQTQIPAEIDEKGEGGVTVPAKAFTELINSLPEETISLQTNGSLLEVVSKKTRSVFQTINKEEFPTLYEEKGEKIATIQSATLKKDFASVVFAASQDTARPALSGVLVDKEGTGFLLVATDGYRLSLKHHVVSDGIQPSDKGEEKVMIIPARVFREVMAIKEEGEGIDMYIAKERNQVLFQLQDTILVGRLIEAEFPKYEKIIPADYAARIGFDREELLKAVKICSIFARDAANIVKLSLRNNKIIVSSQTPSLGENTVEVEAQFSGEENEIAFNARYLLDLLSTLNENELIFEMTGPLNPGVFKIKDDTSFLHLIMPIRVQQ